MDKYYTQHLQLLKALGVEPLALEIAEGKLAIPDASAAIPFYPGQFPPALIPLWGIGSVDYLGYWKHWFTPRKMSIVKVYLGNPIEVQEIALNMKQLAIVIALLDIAGGDPDPTCQHFLHSAGISDVECRELMAISDDTGDLLDGLECHSCFQHNPPLICCADQLSYKGTFLTAYNIHSTDLRNYCGTELSDPVLSLLEDFPAIPAWFEAMDDRNGQSRLFEELLAVGDLRGAWMSLNSPVWNPHSAEQAMRRLAEQAKDPLFSLRATAWIQQSQVGRTRR